MSDITEDEFVDIGCRMAQELNDVLRDAKIAGCEDPFPHMKELIIDWEAVYARSDSSMLAKLGSVPGNGVTKAAKVKPAENVVLLDLRKKGLVEGNSILRPLHGTEMQIAKEHWFSSAMGESCLQPYILYNPKEGLKYLRERLEASFLAGAEAAALNILEEKAN